MPTPWYSKRSADERYLRMVLDRAGVPHRRGLRAKVRLLLHKLRRR